MSNIRFQNALKRIEQNTPPVWFMRQAGRYHSHYQALRAKHSFMELCKQPELAAEVALGPVQEFDFDVSILFSDLLFPLEGFGMGLEYTDHGPRLGYQLTEENISKLNSVDTAVESMQFQAQAMRLTRQALPATKSLIGFVGGPWTLFVYAVEGGHAGSLIKSKSSPELFSKFLKKMVPMLKENIRLQLNAGAELVMLFDTAAGEVSPAFFQEYIQPSLTEFAKEFAGRVAYYSKGTQSAFFNQEFQQLPFAGQGYDHRCYLPDILQHSKKGFVQGNFDQALLHMSQADFKKEFKRWLAPIKQLTLQQRAGWVCGLGHGVLPKTPEQNVKMFVEMIRQELS